MNASRDSNAERQLNPRAVAATAGIALLGAALVQLVLRFLVGFSWFSSIVIGLAVLAGVGLLATLLIVASTRYLKEDVTWLFGNLPPLELRSRSSPGRTTARSSGRPVRRTPQDGADPLSVQINSQSFSLGGRFEADKLFLAGFDKAGSVARVRSNALPGQTVLVARQCAARSFGGEFGVAPLAKGNMTSPAKADTTAFLYFGKPDPTRPFPPPGIERISVIAAGGRLTLDFVTGHFARLATEMFGEPHRGPRAQRIWPAGDLFLVCEEEEYKDLYRSTFTWTTEDLDVRDAG
jgi:hypothetical protein